MARYIGPKTKISRRFNDSIFGLNKSLQKKNYPPGQHGRIRRKKSEYAIQLMEKQKVKYIYGILEKQFLNFFNKSLRKKGVTGEILLQLLESRLDNTVFRLGITSTRRFARQIVSHKHITVNNKIVNIPSFILKKGDVIGIKEKSLKFLSINYDKKYSWLSWDSDKMIGKFLFLPNRKEIPEKINDQSIVELYSK